LTILAPAAVSPLVSTEVKNEWPHSSTSLIRLYGKDRDNFTVKISDLLGYYTA